MLQPNDTRMLENVQILPGKFRNFSGVERNYNSAGKRNFCIVIPDEAVEAMLQDGWALYPLRPLNEGDPERYYMSVAMNYNYRPPKVVLVSGRSRTVLDEETVGMLDWADIIKADLVISAYFWDINGRSGVKAYLREMYVTIEADELAAKYEDEE